MNSANNYGKVVMGDTFINRVDDIKRIQNNINAGINTILISPRRWGKSSLIKQIEYLNNDKSIRTEQELKELWDHWATENNVYPLDGRSWNEKIRSDVTKGNSE